MKRLIILLGTSVLLITTYLLISDEPTGNLVRNIPPIRSIKAFEHNYYYFVILILSIAPVIALSFDRKVAYVRRWPHVLFAALIVGIPYIIWDEVFAIHRVWGFNEPYITGWSLGHLPVEEILFFFVIPMACIFIYECIDKYFPKLSSSIFVQLFATCMIGLFTFLLIIGIDQWYTVTASIVGLVVSTGYLFYHKGKSTKMIWSFLISLLPFIVVNGMLTGMLTKAPVVIYNPLEMTELRIITIPVNDFFYSYGLLGLNFFVYDYLIRGK